MAISHVKKYMYTMQNQYLEMKADLKDFDQALKDGHITEDQLQSVKQDFAQVENNYHRLLYIMHLFEIPSRKKKQPAFREANKTLIDAFAAFNADQAAVVDENTSVLNHFRQQLKRLKQEDSANA